MKTTSFHVRWAVKLNGTWLRHHKGFSYSRGNYHAFTKNIKHARLYTRKSDAEVAVKQHPGSKVVGFAVNGFQND